MECNKDEAARAKEVAEKKFTAKDYTGAKKFALKAQNLFPGLGGIPEMLGILDVYIAAENKVHGESDWYGILGVDPVADSETVKKKYRKLALALHPDKNKSIGADGAFQLISEAWRILSDEANRAAYDRKVRNVRFHPSTVASRFSNSVQSTNISSANAQKSTTKAANFSTSASHKSRTFWTMCPYCMMKFEYLCIYIHQYLRCKDCQNTFMSIEIAAPMNVSKQFTSSNSAKERQNSNLETANRRTFYSGNYNAGPADGQRFSHPLSRTTGSFTGSQAPCVEKRVQSATGGDTIAAKRRCMDGVGMSSFGKDAKEKMEWGAGGTNFGSDRFNGTSHTSCRSDDVSLHASENKQKETGKGKSGNESSVAKSATKEADDGNKRAKYSGNIDVQHNRSMPGNEKQVDTKNISTCDSQEESSSISSDSDADTSEATMPISVPDSDYHDFDKDRTEESFGEDQVWAAYDDDDAMPRQYAKIHKLITLKPLTMQISWLNSKTNRELGSLSWVSSGFTKTCGEFRVGKHEKSKDALNSFSHRVRWTKGTRGVICIYPKKGDVWALYRNWSPDWNESTPDEVIHKYDMVEVVEDYNEQVGVAVIPLAKVSGFKTVYHRRGVMMRISREEMFLLSHQVPCHLLTGEEAPNAPKGCWDLDPAATPAEFLHTVSGFKD